MAYDEALIYATGIVLLNFVQTLSSSQYYQLSNHNAMKVRVAICSLIYRKVHIIRPNRSIDEIK